MSLCDSCKYQYYVEQLKPCIIYRDDCEFYEADDFHEEPKMEQWIEERTYVECPNCHDIWHYEKNQTERFKFCPACGVRIE